MHRDADKIDLPWHGAVAWVVCIIESATEGERAVVREIVRPHTERLGFRRTQHVSVGRSNWIGCRQRTTSAQKRAVIRGV